jgi:hypothetical protein
MNGMGGMNGMEETFLDIPSIPSIRPFGTATHTILTIFSRAGSLDPI